MMMMMMKATKESRGSDLEACVSEKPSLASKRRPGQNAG